MDQSLSIFLCGDVMTGRGIDQILPHPCDSIIYESYVKDAQDYVKLAERVNGPITKPVDFYYIWGNALQPMREADARIINLETSITKSTNYLDKGINYRMHPENIECLTIAGIDCCTLANNHVIDWGKEGLQETLKTLKKAGISYAGAGKNIDEAEEPAIINVTVNNRLLVFSYGLPSSGIPYQWKAIKEKSGVNFLADLSAETVTHISRKIKEYKLHGDLVIASIHWGGNWGYDVSEAHVKFAHNLIDQANVDIIHGHSSHHVKGIEVYKNKPIIYGCGDLLNDYEGISGYESYRGDLGCLYFINAKPNNGHLISLQLVPTQIRKMQLTEPSKIDKNWLQLVLNREGRRFNTSVEWVNQNRLYVIWT